MEVEMLIVGLEGDMDWIVFQASTDAGQTSSISDCCIANESQIKTQKQTQHTERWEEDFCVKPTQDGTLLHMCFSPFCLFCSVFIAATICSLVSRDNIQVELKPLFSLS